MREEEGTTWDLRGDLIVIILKKTDKSNPYVQGNLPATCHGEGDHEGPHLLPPVAPQSQCGFILRTKKT